MIPSTPTVWAAIAPGPRTTRVLATDPAHVPLLTAHLRTDPVHPRALATFLEALALWQGASIRAALVADARCASFAPTLCRAAFAVADVPPLYALTFVDRPTARRADGPGARGAFADLRRALAREAAR